MVKDFFREIVKSKNRFLSILVIVALGVAFFSGIRAASPDMKLSADTYYDETSLMDIQVISSLGLTDEDVEALEQVEGVRTVNPAYSADVLCSLSDSQPVLTLMSLTEDVNKLTVSEGRLPQKDDEIFLDEEFLKSEGFQVGESIMLEAGEGDLSDHPVDGFGKRRGLSFFLLIHAGYQQFHGGGRDGLNLLSHGTGGDNGLPGDGRVVKTYDAVIRGKGAVFANQHVEQYVGMGVIGHENPFLSDRILLIEVVHNLQEYFGCFIIIDAEIL